MEVSPGQSESADHFGGTGQSENRGQLESVGTFGWRLWSVGLALLVILAGGGGQ